MRSRSLSKWAKIGILLGTFFLLSIIAELYVDWLWFDSLGYAGVLWKTLASRWVIGLIVFIIVASFLMFNLLLTRRYHPHEEFIDVTDVTRTPKIRENIYIAVALVIAFVFGLIASDQWIVVQQFHNSVKYGLGDPIFNRDISYYIFNLKFYRIIYKLMMSLAVMTTLTVSVIYLLSAARNLLTVNWKSFDWPKIHLAGLLAFIFLLKSWGYYLDQYNILYSTQAAAFGAGYTDVHARLLAYKVLLVASIIVAAVIVINIFFKRLTWVLLSIGIWMSTAIILGGIYPNLVQKLSVEPNEFNREEPFIKNSIEFTRAAYGLDKVETRFFDIEYNLTASNLEKNAGTISNIRLWDWQPLQETYKAIQEIRPYYTFNDIDVDRYTVNGRYRQVMLGARELLLPGQAYTWVNEKLRYTHGYGIAMSPVNEVNTEGLPNFFLKDIPPRSESDLKVTRPEIYFGEKTNSYVIVKTMTEEFDYPLVNEAATTVYREDAGIRVGSLANRIVLAWVLRDYKLLLSSDITSQSRILLYRNIKERQQKLAPFLRYDSDPYVVLDQGKIYWIQDAYTVSDMFPYSEPYQNELNYIRNSAKIVIDAYTGETTFYIIDQNDPVIRSLANIFPGMFKPFAEMPAGLQEHIRYPEDLFSIQATMYSTYHMTDPAIFYNKEDKWNIPQEKFGDQVEAVKPYYLITRLPGQNNEEFALLLPFTPNNKQNMIGWLYARCDQPNYGKLSVYSFSKQELIYGPMQVESRIDQNSEISQLFTLWNQQGSNVFRGNLLMIPINNSILYVKPIYLQAEDSQIPELKRIIVAYGDNIVMGLTLEDALSRLFEGKATPVTPDVPGEPDTDDTIKALAEAAGKYYDQAQEDLRTGDWAGYGENMKLLGETLEKLESKTGGTK